MTETGALAIAFTLIFAVVGYLGARATEVRPPRSNLPARYIRPRADL